MTRDPGAIEWTPERREILRAAIRKAQAGCEQREAVRMNGAEAAALYKAAECWADMLNHLDDAALSGALKL